MHMWYLCVWLARLSLLLPLFLLVEFGGVTVLVHARWILEMLPETLCVQLYICLRATERPDVQRVRNAVCYQCLLPRD